MLTYVIFDPDGQLQGLARDLPTARKHVQVIVSLTDPIEWEEVSVEKYEGAGYTIEGWHTFEEDEFEHYDLPSLTDIKSEWWERQFGSKET